MAKVVSKKNEAAHRWCQCPLRMPVSMLAVLPIRHIEPIMPSTIATSGRYCSSRKACSLAKFLRQKWLVSHPSRTRTDPDIVDILKMMNYGQWPAQELMQVLGMGGSWPSSRAIRQMATRLPMSRQLAVLKKMDGENSPSNIYVNQTCTPPWQQK